jgi:predicted PurR-regulated permease PerM
MPPVAQPPPPPERPAAEPSPTEASATGTPPAGTPSAETAAPKVKRAGRADPALQQRSVASLFLALLSLFGVLGLSNFQRGVYIVAFALVAGIMAVWLAATAMRRARRRGTAGPRGSVVAIVIGGVGVLTSAVLLAGFALFGKQASTFSQCLSGANTVAAQQTCRTQFTRAIQNATH